MDFAEKYRPTKVEDFIGSTQIDTAKAIYDTVNAGKLPQKMLFLGKSGLGKTSLAMFYASLLDAEIHHINCIDKSSVDYVRDLIETLKQPSLFAKYTIYLLDELHGWSTKAQEGLLVELERLPEHIIFLAGSTEPQKLKTTLSSRFKQVHLSLPTTKELKQYMLRIFESEGIVVSGDVEGRVIDGEKIKIGKQYANDILVNSNGNIRTLITNIEGVLDGTFGVGTLESGGETVPQLWQDIVKGHCRYDYDIADYTAVTNGLCFYVLGILRKDPVNKLAQKVLVNFTHNLIKGDLPPEVEFYSRLTVFMRDYFGENM